MAHDINSEQFGESVLKSTKYVLVDFWAPWCMPCRAMAPVLDELSQDKDLKDNLKIVKLNIEEGNNGQLANLYGVRGIPNMKLFHKGELVEDFVGMRPLDMFKEELINAINDSDEQ